MSSTANGRMPVRVFLVDDHEVVRRGVAELLAAHEDLEVVGEASDVRETLARVPAAAPDVVVLDVRLPDGDGVTLCRELRSRDDPPACLMLTSVADDEALFDAIMAGAAGFVLKQVRGSDLVEAVRTVAAGGSMLDAQAAARVMARMRRPQTPREDPRTMLTDQERRILELVGEGLTNRQIATRMGLAEKTVKNYVSSLLAKLGLHGRVEAAVLAVRLERDGDDGVDRPAYEKYT
ncbi:response regulator [Puerhibacterium sp. TATVAM-FAB25]|uniref:response regulator n=1 Tax=Puerhibacterium sp. TATVAM-FAB25 TaxID=3093699 RepID=UPI003979CE11